MYCTNCGNKLNEEAKFCDSCGTKTLTNIIVDELKISKSTGEGSVYKCPSCGETINHDTLICPSCNHEIRGRIVSSSIQTFYEKINFEKDEKVKIELIKTFPIPNNREDIIEFMLLASSNFDARHYATNKATDSVSGAWLSKIDQCYKKGKIMLTSPGDLIAIESIYKEAHAKTKDAQKSKLITTLVGILLTVSSLVLIMTFGESQRNLGYIFMSMLVIGIVLIVSGLRKNKTNREIEEEKLNQETKKQQKNNQFYQENEEVYENQQADKKPFRHSVLTSSGRVVNKNIYLFLAITLGWAGVHRRYAGQRSMAWLYLFTLGLLGIGWISDIFKATKQPPDTRGNIVV